jgi:hypothetical protein
MNHAQTRHSQSYRLKNIHWAEERALVEGILPEKKGNCKPSLKRAENGKPDLKDWETLKSRLSDFISIGKRGEVFFPTSTGFETIPSCMQ